MTKPRLIIAGPGAGKTYNMVQTIIDMLPTLSSSRYMVVITYTNSAADNIKNRLSKKINIPKNVYIGTIHSFLNKFVVIPFSSLNSDSVGSEKLFIQCDTDGIFESLKKEKKRNYNVKEAATIKAQIKTALNKKGYISFDQSVAIAKECIDNASIANILSNRIQFLFVDEFQDTNNSIFYILDKIRKLKMTELYCVGDPEQFIQSFDITSKVFTNIPILKISSSNQYDTNLNQDNHRCTQTIVAFLNRFNGRRYSNNVFLQESKTSIEGTNVVFINQHTNATAIVPVFSSICDTLNILPGNRCIIAKKNEIVNRIIAALGNDYKTPNKSTANSPVKTIIDAFLASLQLNQTDFFKTYKTDALTLRKYGILILKKIQNGSITNENTFANFITETLGYTLKSGIPINVDMIRNLLVSENNSEAMMISNIHNIKGLEADAVLAIAKTQEELNLWIETDRTIREAYRNKEKTDYPRLGYVAFSRAKLFLSIACLEAIDDATRNKLEALNVEIR